MKKGGTEKECRWSVDGGLRECKTGFTRVIEIYAFGLTCGRSGKGVQNILRVPERSAVCVYLEC